MHMSQAVMHRERRGSMMNHGLVFRRLATALAVAALPNSRRAGEGSGATREVESVRPMMPKPTMARPTSPSSWFGLTLFRLKLKEPPLGRRDRRLLNEKDVPSGLPGLWLTLDR